MEKDNTIFDDVFRTIIEKMPELTITLINEVFHTSYPLDEKIVQLRNEFHTVKGEKIMDSLLLIGGKLYHLECQSTDDRTMAIRMIEYDILSAVERASHDGRRYHMELPHSCVVYLRDTKNTPDELEVELVSSDGRIFLYTTPTLKVSRYPVQEILEKRLFALLPYYCMRYENAAADIGRDPEKLEALLQEFYEIRTCLEKEFTREGKSVLYTNLIGLIKRIADYIFREEEAVQKGIGDVMGGKALQLESERLHEEGRAEGRVEGRAECEKQLNLLYGHLADAGRYDDLKRSTQDSEYQKQLLREFGITD